MCDKFVRTSEHSFLLPPPIGVKSYLLLYRANIKTSFLKILQTFFVRNH